MLFRSMTYHRAIARPLPGRDELLWYSAQDGWGHLYTVDLVHGGLRRQLTRGDWAVFDIVAVRGDALYITAGGRDPLPADHRIQSTASMSESLGQFRENFVELSDKVESGLSGISSTFAELNDENTILSVKQTLGKLEVNTTEIAAGRGTHSVRVGVVDAN